jgi:hypothetical protein
MLTLATWVVVVANILVGFHLGLGPRQPAPLLVLHVLWPAASLLALWQLAPFCSNTNTEGGDITNQILMYGLAMLQVPLFGIAAGVGALSAFVARHVPAATPIDPGA